MSKALSKHPHDEFFKAVFSNVKTTAAFLKHYLPPAVIAVLDMDSLKQEKDTLSGDELKTWFSDLLFSVKAGNRTGYIYILLEHKSYKDPFLALQLLRYTQDLRLGLSTKGVESGSEAQTASPAARRCGSATSST